MLGDELSGLQCHGNDLRCCCVSFFLLYAGSARDGKLQEMKEKLQERIDPRPSGAEMFLSFILL